MADRIGDRDQTTKGGKSSHATRKVDTKLAVKKTAAKGKLLRIPINLRDLLALNFRKQFKEDNSEHNSVVAVGKLVWQNGSQWQDTTPFIAKADKRKKKYEKSLEFYNKKLVKSLLQVIMMIMIQTNLVPYSPFPNINNRLYYVLI
ncbi:unnamed protein product [Lactuca virosa]|uniref:HMG box domain-containing protein n=1 Tax=Lactuca virosa TaxID=75947 RepID=A0AAU9PVE4_9ASTR|nr:unnamed protein product [Lactuca virosa]